MNEELVLEAKKSQEVTTVEKTEQYIQAKALVDSRLVPNWIKTPERCMIALQYCKELGMPAALGLGGMYIVNDIPCLTGKAFGALIRQRGGSYRVIKDFEKVFDENGKWVDSETVIEAKRPDEQWTHLVRVTMLEMKEMGLTSKDQWKKQPGVMLYWRCVSKMGRMVFPDFTMGLYMPEEIDNSGLIYLDEEGNVIENKK